MTTRLSSQALNDFIRAYPGMRIKPATGPNIVLTGTFEFAASWDGVDVDDAYQLRIEVPPYPADLPRVFEIGGRIKPIAEEHAFTTGQLCLGSELRLRTILGSVLDLVRFANQCIVPYLYATTRRGGEHRYVLGELAHGRFGLVEDYKDLLGVHDEESVRAALRALTTKRSSANRHPCPCGCRKRLVQCTYQNRIDELRMLAPREVFRRIFKAAFPASKDT